MNNNLIEISKKLQEINKVIPQVFNETFKKFQVMNNIFPPNFLNNIEKIQEALAPLATLASAQMTRVGEWSRKISSIPKKSKPVLEYLVDSGWYLIDPFNLGTLDLVADMMEAKDFDGIDEYMMSYAIKHQDEIIEGLISEFPKREKIISDAFEASKDGKYTLSIPVFLAQADGIAQEILQKKLFSSSGIKEKDMKILLKINRDNSIYEAIILSFAAPMYTNNLKKSYQIDEDFPLNRNMILHGIDLNYQSKINGMKIITFLGYLNTIITLVKD